MTRPKQHEIDERAKRVFPTLLPPSWVIREQNPDYRIDYQIELFEDSEPCGLFFNVQLKGAISPRLLTGGARAFSLKTRHLSYYFDKVPLPVFLVLVDVEKKSAWWVFLQKHVRLVLKDDSWRKRKSVSIRIPPDNSLADNAKLRRAIQDAEAFMRDLRPSSIQASIKAEKTRLQELDPRFTATILAKDGNTEIQLNAHQPAKFKLRFRGEEAVRKARAIYEGGGKYEFKPGELAIEGSPIFDFHGNELHAIQVSNRRDVTLRLIADHENNGGELHLDIPATLSGGHSRCEIVGALPQSPLSIKLSFDLIEQSSECIIGFDLGQWIGQEVRFLAFVDPIAVFLRAVSSEPYLEGSKLIKAQVLLLGNAVVDGAGNLDVANVLADYEPIVATLAKAKYVATEMGQDVKLRSDIGPEHAYEIEVVHNLIKSGEFSYPSPNAKCELKVHPQGVTQFLNLAGDGVTGVPFCTFDRKPLPFLGREVDLGPLQVEFTSLVVANDRESLVRGCDSNLATVDVKLVATPDCVYRLRRVAEEELPAARTD